MTANTRENLHGLKLITFESRRAQEMAELIRRYGGEPVIAPSTREVPLSENRAAIELLPEGEAGKFDIIILLTGVGTRRSIRFFSVNIPRKESSQRLEMS
jgi:uroporphyrinogen-III synthase